MGLKQQDRRDSRDGEAAGMEFAETETTPEHIQRPALSHVEGIYMPPEEALQAHDKGATAQDKPAAASPRAVQPQEGHPHMLVGSHSARDTENSHDNANANTGTQADPLVDMTKASSSFGSVSQWTHSAAAEDGDHQHQRPTALSQSQGSTQMSSPQASPAPAYSALPAATLHSQQSAAQLDLDTDRESDQKDGPISTIEPSSSTAQIAEPVQAQADQHGSTSKPSRFKLRLPKPGKRRRRLFREPITTITSTIMPGRKRNTHTGNGATTAGTNTTSTAGLLAPPRFGRLASTLSDDATGHSLTEIPSKTSGGYPQSPPVDAESGINDVRGTNGLLQRVHGSWSLIALTMANIGPVPGAFFGVHTAKEYGGYSMLAIGWPLSGLCMCLFSAVLAELASSYPVAGAMFTWTFRTCRLSPRLRPFARYLSWICGSLLLCGHVLAQMLLEFQIATVLQGLIIIFAQDYQPSTWRTILLAWACLLVSAGLAVNRFGRSPWLWKGVSVLIVSTALILVISLFACTSYRNSPSIIFTSYRNETGWSSKGYVYLLGWVLTSIATGQDIAGHLAEEAKHPTKTVPIGVFWGTAISYLVGWVVMLCLMAVTPEIPHGSTPTRDYGAPAQILTEILPRPLAFIILLLIVILMIFQDTAQLLASSRFMWALARDSAIPFSPYLRRLSAGSQLPIRATWTVCAIAAPCLLLIAGSRQIVTSLILSGCGSSLVLSYAIPVVCYLACPKGALDIDGRNEWTLRGASRYAAAIGTCYVTLIIIMMCCPNFYPVTSTSFSYAAPVIAFVLLLSSLTWIFYGNSHYAGPIKSITVYTIGREVELPKLTSTGSANRHTPHGARPSSPRGLNGFHDPSATTGVEIGKTANLYSESLRTMDFNAPPETTDISNELVTQSWRSTEGASRTGHTHTEVTETQMTDYTDYTSDGSYTDSESHSDSDSGEDASGAAPVTSPEARHAEVGTVRRST